MSLYLRDPAAIYRRSFEIIRAEADLGGFTPGERAVVERVIHACGMPDIVADLRFGGDAVAATHTALGAGAPIFTDSRMAASGVIRDRLPAGNAVTCLLDLPGVDASSKELATTRSAASIDAAADRLGGAVVVIGNAPTALFRLLERLDDGAPCPAVVLGFPVGFVGAAESKAALAGRTDVPFITVLGRRGGSAMAAGALNALAGEAP